MSYNFPVKLLKNALLYTILILLLGFSLLGLNIKTQSANTKVIGAFNLEAYKYGLNLNQNRTTFYNFSPYDSYFVDKAGERKKFANWEYEIFSRESSTTGNVFENIYSAVLSAFNRTKPQATFDTQYGVVKIMAETNGNKVKVSVKAPSDIQSNKTVLSLSYNTSDIIFTEDGTTLNKPNEELLEKTSKFYSYVFDSENVVESTPSEKKKNPPKYIYVFNPNNTGVLVLNLDENENIEINIEDGLIEFSGTKNEATAVIEVFNSFAESFYLSE